MNYYRGVLVSADEGKAKLTRSDNGEEVIIDEAKLCWYVFSFYTAEKFANRCCIAR